VKVTTGADVMNYWIYTSKPTCDLLASILLQIFIVFATRRAVRSSKVHNKSIVLGVPQRTA
jgi:hypothetical protein